MNKNKVFSMDEINHVSKVVQNKLIEWKPQHETDVLKDCGIDTLF